MSEMTQPGAIYSLIPAIMAEVGAVGKDRKNTQQNYNFRGIDDVLNALHPVLAKHGVFVLPSVLDASREERTTKSGSALIYSYLRVQFTFAATDGSFVAAITEGEGMDSGDKATAKAMSAALKYALLTVFAIPTEEAPDSEYESHEVAPRSGRKQPVREESQGKTEDERAVPIAWGKLYQAILHAYSIEAREDQKAKARELVTNEYKNTRLQDITAQQIDAVRNIVNRDADEAS